MDDERFRDEDRQFTGPEGEERGEDENAPVAAPEEPAAVDEDAVTGEGLRRSGRVEDRLDQEEPDPDRAPPPAEEEREEIDAASRAERDEAGRLVEEEGGLHDREKDQVSEEAQHDATSPSAEEEAVRVEDEAPGGVDGEGADRYVEEP